MSIFAKFTPIATALSPNTETDDILLVLKLFLPRNWNKWKKGAEIEKLENEFRKYFGVKYAISFSAGRVGLYAILKSLAEPLQTEIITQAYTTIAIPNAIKRAGFKPIYVDINENTYNIDPNKIEAKINLKTKAIIIQHTFGIPAEMDKIRAICKKHGLILIEDCAHSLGAEFNGRKIGTFGDAAFFSFGRDKIISSTSGGMAITNNETLGGKIKDFQCGLPFPPHKWIFQQLMHPVVFAIALPVYYLFDLGKLKIVLGQKLGLISRAYGIKEKKGIGSENYELPNALAVLTLNQFKKLERFNGQRIKLAKFYEKNLIDNRIKTPKISPEVKATPLYYTIQTAERDKILKMAQKNHIVLGDWFPGALGPKDIDSEKFEYKTGECPIAEKVGKRSLNLPTNIKTAESDAKKIIDLIKEFLDRSC